MVKNTDYKLYLPTFEDGFFDLIIGDPPYFDGPNKRGYYGKSISTTSIKRKNYPNTNDWEIPNQDYIDLCKSKSKDQIIFGINYYKVHHCIGRIIWDKVNGNSSFSDAEIASCTYHDSVRLFRYMWNGMMQGKSIYEGHVMQGNKKLKQNRIHPTEKPVDLYRWIFSTYIPSGGKVFDTHLGSGSSRIAADMMGNIEFYGCEINKTHFDNQESRFNQYKSQLKLELI